MANNISTCMPVAGQMKEGKEKGRREMTRSVVKAGLKMRKGV